MAQLKKVTLNIFLLISGALLLQGQTSFQVVTKKVEQTFDYKTGYELNIEGEKAEISVESWDQPLIKIELEIQSEHPDKATARNDVEKVRYEMVRHGEKIYARNYVDASERPASSLSARYTITMPRNCPIYIKNHYGEVNVSDLANSLRFNGQFSPIGLNNVTGYVEVRSRFGDVDGRQLNGDLNFYARRSDVTLRDLKGVLNLESQYGQIRLARFAALTGLNIQAEKSDVFLDIPNFDQFAFLIESNQSKMNIPNALDFKYVENREQFKKIEFKPNREYYATVSIQITIGDLTIEKRD